jgi:hypothetical protein
MANIFKIARRVRAAGDRKIATAGVSLSSMIDDVIAVSR